MTDSLLPDTNLIKLALSCKCPKCRKGNLYKPGLNMEVQDVCPECGLNLSEHDCGDGPAVFMIFILGFLLVPAALLVEKIFDPALWMHAILWGVIAIGITTLASKPLKAYIIALQFKHRPGNWDNNKTDS